MSKHEAPTIKKTATTIHTARNYVRMMKGLGLEVRVAGYGWWQDDDGGREHDVCGNDIDIMSPTVEGENGEQVRRPTTHAAYLLGGKTYMIRPLRFGIDNPGYFAVFGTQY